MQIFKDEQETKRVIFNVDHRLAARLENAKALAKQFGKKLNVDSVVDSALAVYLEEAEKQLSRLEREPAAYDEGPIVMGPSSDDIDVPADAKAVQVRQSSAPAKSKKKE